MASMDPDKGTVGDTSDPGKGAEVTGMFSGRDLGKGPAKKFDNP